MATVIQSLSQFHPSLPHLDVIQLVQPHDGHVHQQRGYERHQESGKGERAEVRWGAGGGQGGGEE